MALFDLINSTTGTEDKDPMLTLTSPEDIRKELDVINQQYQAISGTVEANQKAGTQNPQLVDKLRELDARKSELESKLAESPGLGTDSMNPIKSEFESPIKGGLPSYGPSNLLQGLNKAQKSETGGPANQPTSLSDRINGKSEDTGAKLGAGITRPEGAAATPTEPTEAETLSERLKKAEETRAKEKSSAEFGEVADLVARSLAKIGAAQAGMKRGVYLGEVGEKPLVDWSKRLDQVETKYKNELDSISKDKELLLKKEEKAIDAKNDQAILNLKKQELGLATRETNAKIAKLQAETELARKGAASQIGVSKEVQQVIDREISNFDKTQVPALKVKIANAEINTAIDEAQKLEAQGKSGEAGFLDKAAVTAYLKQLDPESAVLAAEYADARDIGKLVPLLEAKFKDLPPAVADYLKSGFTKTLQPPQRKFLRDAANANYKVRNTQYAEQTRSILRRAHQAGVPDPVLIIGRPPLTEELDDVTAKAWGTGAATPTTPSKPAVAEAPAVPTSRVEGVVKRRASDLK